MDGRNGRPRKRQKLDRPAEQNVESLDIQSSHQLQKLLQFQQDLEALRRGLKSFRSFLKSVHHEGIRTNQDIAKRHSLLREYLETQNYQDENKKDGVFIPDIMQTWSFASQSNDDPLLAAVPDVLALLLNVISTMIDFRDYGINLCRTILSTAQLKLLARGLSTSQAKDQIIAPCLRLLTDVISFDGGLFSRKVYTCREFTFRSLARNLNLRRLASENAGKNDKKITIREHALRFFLVNLVFQDAARRGDLIAHRDIISALFKDVREDDPVIIIEILATLEKHIIRDKAIHSKVKSEFLSDWVLGRIATLYGHQSSQGTSENKDSVRRKAHDILLLVCTTQGLGVLLPQSGWYPPGFYREETNPRGILEEFDTLDIKQQGVDFFNKHREKIPVRNLRLAAFASTLRPYSDTLQSELLLGIFKAAPELVADYFFRKRSFSFDPKLTATWTGYSMFLYSVVQTPIPRFCGSAENFSQAPPPVSIVIESILPQPLTRKALTRCLHQQSGLIRLFAVRLLIAAFEKLQKVLQIYMSFPGPNASLWEHAALELVAESSRRCPTMKDVITAFRATRINQLLQREALARLLSMYYRVTPQAALDEVFDISVPLSKAISKVESSDLANNDSGMDLLMLERFLDIAQRTPNMRWIHRSEHLRLSLFTALFKIHVQLPEGPLRQKINSLLRSINREAQTLQEQSQLSALGALNASLSSLDTPELTAATYEYLDNSLIRLFQRPVHYEDKLATLLQAELHGTSVSGHAPISLLLVALVEQWSFLARSNAIGSAEKAVAATFLSRLLGNCKQIGENEAVLIKLREDLVHAPGNYPYRSMFSGTLNYVPESFRGPFDESIDVGRPLPSSHLHEFASEHEVPQEEDEFGDGTEDELKESDGDPNALFTWVRKEAQDAVEDGDTANLILCLCSSDQSIRMQALGALTRMVQKLETSSYSEKQTMTLLLQETIHTARPIIRQRPFPTYHAAFATRALSIEADPQHPLYPKLNHFLHEGPVWEIDRLPLVQKILLHPPDDDDAHFQEIEWLIELLAQGLRTEEDLDTYRRQHIFERCLSLYSSPYLPIRIRKRIIQIVWRATAVPSGSTTLVTRSGVLSWIYARLALNDSNDVTLKRLATRLQQDCDQDHVAAWCRGSMDAYMADIGHM